MWKVVKYSFYEMIRSRWILFYFLFSMLILFMDNTASKAVISLLQLILILCPLVSIIFTTMYYYNSREFTELLLAQPIPRRSIFMGQYIGVSSSLAGCILLGISIPVLIMNPKIFSESAVMFIMLIAGLLLTLIFSAIGFNVCLRNESKIRGFSYALFLWLFFAIIYDGLILSSLFVFKDYPLEHFAIVVSLANPIDLSRILIILKLETSALMGYTGAVFDKFFGSSKGMLVTGSFLILWLLVPVYRFLKFAEKKNF